MSHNLDLFEQPGLVFETHRPDQFFFLGDENEGRLVPAGAPPVREIRVSAYLVVPLLPDDRQGLYNVLTLARGKPGRGSDPPQFWNPVRLARFHGGVYLYVTYDAARGRFGVRMNVGADDKKLSGFYLENLPPAKIAGRLLRLVVVITEDLLFAAVDAEDDDGPLIAEDHGSASTGRRNRPWGQSAAGHWFVQIGVGDDGDERSLSFPPGFGVSDAAIAFVDGPESLDHSPPYSGALAHLVGKPDPGDAEPPETVTDFLFGLAADFRAQSAEGASWSRRLGDWADQAERWAERVET